MSQDSPAASVPARATHSSDAFLAVRNAGKLFLSLLGTWGISLAIQFLLPRLLGPAQFGLLSYTETFTATICVVMSLGLDIYIRKEIPVRPEHASDFFGTVLAIRTGMWVLLMAGMLVFVGSTERSPVEHQLVLVFGAAQFTFILGENLKALLHSRGTVDGLSVANVGFKLLWGLGVLGAVLWLDGSLLAVALALLVSRSLEAVVLFVLARKHLHLRLRWASWGTFKLIVLGSLPFYLNAVALQVSNKIDGTLLTHLANEQVTGWYYGAARFTDVLMMLAPMIGWVMMPLFARAYHRDQAEFTKVVRRALELVLAISIPLSLAMALGADLVVGLVLGPEYGPSVDALRLLAPINAVTYINTLCAIVLIIQSRAWTVTAISGAAMVLNPLLNFILVPAMIRAYGPPAGGLACALTQLITQCATSVVMVSLVGKIAFDRRTLVMVAKSVGVCAAVVGVDHLARDQGWGRLFLDGLAYLALILVVRALPLRETLDFARQALKRKDVSPAV